VKLHKDLREFIELLNANRVKYLIVGGYALAYHGRPRLTGDTDFFVESSDANARRIENVIKQFGFADLGLSAADFLRPDVVIQLGYPPNRIDIVTSISGVTFEAAWPQRVNDVFGGVPVHVLSRELLVRNKAASARPQDIADIKALTEDDLE
jgi:hypothetical protein